MRYKPNLVQICPTGNKKRTDNSHSFFFRIQRDFNHSLVLDSITNFVIYCIAKYSKLKKYLALSLKNDKGA